jgi:hypothetical protein
MVDVPNLSDARVQVNRAKYHYAELGHFFEEWTESGGIGVQIVRDPIFVRCWHEPSHRHERR